MNAINEEANQNDILDELAVMLKQNDMPDAEGIERIKNAMAADYIVSKEEADGIFSLKAAFPEIVNVQGFDELYVNGIISFLLYTGESKGSLDNLEYIWLSEQFAEDHVYDDLEKRLLIELTDRAEQTPPNLHELIKKF